MMLQVCAYPLIRVRLASFFAARVTETEHFARRDSSHQFYWHPDGNRVRWEGSTKSPAEVTVESSPSLHILVLRSHSHLFLDSILLLHQCSTLTRASSLIPTYSTRAFQTSNWKHVERKYFLVTRLLQNAVSENVHQHSLTVPARSVSFTMDDSFTKCCRVPVEHDDVTSLFRAVYEV